VSKGNGAVHRQTEEANNLENNRNNITKLAHMKSEFGANDSIKVSANDIFFLAQMICEFGLICHLAQMRFFASNVLACAHSQIR